MSYFLHLHCRNFVCFFDSSVVVIKHCLKIMHKIYTVLKKTIILSKILSYFDSIFDSNFPLILWWRSRNTNMRAPRFFTSKKKLFIIYSAFRKSKVFSHFATCYKRLRNSDQFDQCPFLRRSSWKIGKLVNFYLRI